MIVKRVPVLHLIDSLSIGGAERVAVNIANALPQERFESHLGVTRADGPLRDEIKPHVQVVFFERRRALDICGLIRIVRYARKHKIAIVHAHSTSLFIAAVASLFLLHTRIVWHDHFGRADEIQRSPILYRLAARRIQAVIAVSDPLVRWLRNEVGISSDHLYLLPNFSALLSKREEESPSVDLPGKSTQRIVCVANLRPQKDHLTLVRAMGTVVEEVPNAHLLLVGATTDKTTVDAIIKEISLRGLDSSITITGTRTDVEKILLSCTIGVLSSKSEGFPLALIEYGLAGLAVVATHVGQCPEILAEGEAGILVVPEDPLALAAALLHLLCSEQERLNYSTRLHKRVQDQYSADAIIGKLVEIYEKALEIQ